jgi:hypothetical protein
MGLCVGEVYTYTNVAITLDSTGQRCRGLEIRADAFAVPPRHYIRHVLFSLGKGGGKVGLLRIEYSS